MRSAISTKNKESSEKGDGGRGGRCKEKITEEVIFERPTVEARQRHESL